MKTWHIWDFPDTTYIYLKDNFREEFFTYMFKKFGGKRPYARFLGLTQRAVIFYYKGYTYKNGLKHPQAIPIWVFKKSAHLIDEDLKKKLENNLLLLKAKNKGIPLFNPIPLPTIMAVGVARPKAQGQAITRTEIMMVKAKINSFWAPKNQMENAIREIMTTAGTK